MPGSRLPFPERENWLWPGLLQGGLDQIRQCYQAADLLGPARPPTPKAQSTELALELLTHASVLIHEPN